MSRVYFHSPSGDAELRGSERAYMAGKTNHAALDLFVNESSMSAETVKAWRAVLPADCYLLTDRGIGRSFSESFSTWLVCHGHHDDNLLYKDGVRVPVWDMILNTCCDLGGDFLILCARIHAQCECHCYIEGQNRKWFAGILRNLYAKKLLRRSQNWEGVMDFLESREDEPVVLSYSVCESFPNADAANFPLPEGEDGEKDWDAFNIIPVEEQWRLGMAGLRAVSGLEISPETWATARYGRIVTFAEYTDWLFNDSGFYKPKEF